MPRRRRNPPIPIDHDFQQKVAKLVRKRFDSEILLELPLDNGIANEIDDIFRNPFEYENLNDVLLKWSLDQIDWDNVSYELDLPGAFEASKR